MKLNSAHECLIPTPAVCIRETSRVAENVRFFSGLFSGFKSVLHTQKCLQILMAYILFPKVCFIFSQVFQSTLENFHSPFQFRVYKRITTYIFVYVVYDCVNLQSSTAIMPPRVIALHAFDENFKHINSKTPIARYTNFHVTAANILIIQHVDNSQNIVI